MHCKGDGDDTVGEEHTDVLGNGGVTNQLDCGKGSHNEESVEEDNADDGLLVGGLLDVCTADEDSSDGVKAHVILLLDSVEGAQVLQEDELTPCCKHGRDAGGDDTGLVDIDTGGGGNCAALTDSTHVLTQTGIDQPVVEGCKEGNQGKGHDGQAGAEIDSLNSGDKAACQQNNCNNSTGEKLLELLAALGGALEDEHNSSINKNDDGAEEHCIIGDQALLAKELVHHGYGFADDANSQQNDGSNELEADLLGVDGIALLLVVESHNNGGDEEQHSQNTDGGQQADVINSILEVAGQVECVTQTKAAVQQIGAVVGDDAAHDVENKETVKTCGKEAEDQTGYHLSTLGLVEELTQQPAEEDGQRGGHEHAEHEASDAGKAPMNDPEDGDLSCDSADDDTEVHAQTCHAGDDKGQDDACVTAETGDDFACDVGNTCTGNRDTCKAQQDEQKDDLVVKHKLLYGSADAFLFKSVVIHQSEPPLT